MLMADRDRMALDIDKVLKNENIWNKSRNGEQSLAMILAEVI
jgi:hypothetical protein